MAKMRTRPRVPEFSEEKKQRFRRRQILLGSFLILLGFLLTVSFISFLFHHQSDQSTLEAFFEKEIPSKNLLNKVGASVSHFFIYQLFGIATFLLPYLMGYTGYLLFFDRNKKQLLNHWSWAFLYMMCLSVFFGFYHMDGPLLGGLVGFEINSFLVAYLGTVGVGGLLIFSLVVILVFQWQLTPEKVILFVRSLFKKEESPASIGIENSLDLEIDDFVETSSPPPIVPKSEPLVVEKTAEEEEVTMEVESYKEEESLTDNLAQSLVEKHGFFDPKLELSKYRFPVNDLLKDYGESSITIDQEELELNKNKIVDTLKNYNIGISKIKATVGPTVTLYEIVPEAGIRISKIKNLEDDIALSLSALGIRIIAPIPGKGTIGIEVPNQKPSIVSMRSVIASNKFQTAEMELPIALGKNISNETFVVDLTKMPHLLMAGATGQGKSVGLNAVLTSLLYKKHPAEIKFVLVDPKKVELNIYNKIERHYLAKLPDTEEAIITDNTKVIHTLNSLCIEMDNRYELLKNGMCRNLKEYNQKYRERKLNPKDGHSFLPYIVLVVDEFADLIMTAGKEVETPIARLAQLARAVGIHLIIATQRPSVNVITGIIKANFPARIAFRVTSKIDSRTILDSGGADQLIGRGDMLYTQGNELTRIQCAFVDTPEVQKISDYIGSQMGYANAYILPEYVEENASTLDLDPSDRDDLFREAAEVIVTAQQGSASLLQRKLKLGYNRAGRIIDQMEVAGIVGPFEGSKARQVLISDLIALDALLNSEDV
ncbi:MAG: DNA translocase FtsK [Flavobacteriaceae bacterium]|jgi:S-DNA-T family DNA segregation ATPase FtsK/SpoIIIE|nr:DNA translocase FtsK [Flavobacteriaceae bacterium]